MSPVIPKLIRPVSYRSVPYAVTVVVLIVEVRGRTENADLRYPVIVPVTGHRDVSGDTEAVRPVSYRTVPYAVTVVVLIVEVR